jgi:hypothetical protein
MPNPHERAAVIGGVFALLAACIGGIFIIINTLIAEGFIISGPKFQVGESPTEIIVQPSTSNTNPIDVRLPDTLTCQLHISGYCGLSITVNWKNINQNENYYIYAIGHGLYYEPELWWVSGSGIPITSESGQATITDGAYGNANDLIGIFACLTKTKHTFDNVDEITFLGRPPCELYSPEVTFTPNK